MKPLSHTVMLYSVPLNVTEPSLNWRRTISTFMMLIWGGEGGAVCVCVCVCDIYKDLWLTVAPAKIFIFIHFPSFEQQKSGLKFQFFYGYLSPSRWRLC